MNKSEFENRSLVYIIAISYSLNLLFSLFGFCCNENTTEQILFFQIGNAFAISAAVMAARYTGLRGQHVAASAYILLGITHGISLAALSRASISVDRGMTMVMPMIPALVCMFWCSLYPKWLRYAGMIPSLLFVIVYINVLQGQTYFDWPLQLGYATLRIIEVLWALYLWKDWKQLSIRPS